MKAKKPEKNRDRLRRSFREQWATNRPALIVWLMLQPVVLAALVRSVMLGSWDNVFICLLVLALFLLPSIVQKNLRITFPTGMQIVILIHIFATEFLGEIACYYVQYPHWDSIVHTVWGFLCAAIGYLLVDLLNRDMPERFHLSPAYLAVAAFCFSMTIGVLWEFFEFAMDRLFLMDMQKDTIIPQFASTLLDETHHNIPVVVSGIDSVTVNGQVLASGGDLDIGLYPCSFGIWELQSLESLHQKSLRDIWNGEQFTQYRSKMKEKCSSCSMTSLCRLGCRLDLDIDLCYS